MCVVHVVLRRSAYIVVLFVVGCVCWTGCIFAVDQEVNGNCCPSAHTRRSAWWCLGWCLSHGSCSFEMWWWCVDMIPIHLVCIWGLYRYWSSHFCMFMFFLLNLMLFLLFLFFSSPFLHSPSPAHPLFLPSTPHSRIFEIHLSISSVHIFIASHTTLAWGRTWLTSWATYVASTTRANTYMHFCVFSWPG